MATGGRCQAACEHAAVESVLIQYRGPGLKTHKSIMESVVCLCDPLGALSNGNHYRLKCRKPMTPSHRENVHRQLLLASVVFVLVKEKKSVDPRSPTDCR